MMDQMQTGTALTVISPREISTIIAADQDDILGKLAARVATFKPDISTVAGRDDMRSLAYEISRGKTSLVKLGKSLTEGWRKQTAAVNAECRIIEERMDALRDQVRGPLTEWENREKARVEAHEAALRRLESPMPEREVTGDVEAFAALLESVERIYTGRAWEEFATRAAAAHDETKARLERSLHEAQRRAEEAAELGRLRAAEAERQRQEAERLQAEREARIAAEAAERARVAAEQAERDRTAAVEAERQRAAREQADAEAAQRKRAANRAHAAKVVGETWAAIVQAIAEVHSGTPQEADAIARAVVEAIVRQEIPHVSIAY